MVTLFGGAGFACLVGALFVVVGFAPCWVAFWWFVYWLLHLICCFAACVSGGFDLIFGFWGRVYGAVCLLLCWVWLCLRIVRLVSGVYLVWFCGCSL